MQDVHSIKGIHRWLCIALPVFSELNGISALFPLPDGIHQVEAYCTLRVTIITDDMLTNSITVRLENMSQERFLSPLLNLFLEGVAAVLSTKREAVFVFNIQNDTDVQGSILNVTFSALQPGSAPGKGTFFPSEELQEQIYLNRTLLRLISSQEVTYV